MNSFTKADLVKTIENTSNLMSVNKDFLTDLDSQIGDGDLGLTMTKGFAAAAETAHTLEEDDIGMMMRKIGFKEFDYSKAGVYGSNDWKKLAEFDSGLARDFDAAVERNEARK